MKKFLTKDVLKIVILSIITGIIGGFGTKFTLPLLPDSLLKDFGMVMFAVSFGVCLYIGNIIGDIYNKDKNDDYYGGLLLIGIAFIIILVIVFLIVFI